MDNEALLDLIVFEIRPPLEEALRKDRSCGLVPLVSRLAIQKEPERVLRAWVALGNVVTFSLFLSYVATKWFCFFQLEEFAGVRPDESLQSGERWQRFFDKERAYIEIILILRFPLRQLISPDAGFFVVCIHIRSIVIAGLGSGIPTSSFVLWGTGVFNEVA